MLRSLTVIFVLFRTDTCFATTVNLLKISQLDCGILVVMPLRAITLSPMLKNYLLVAFRSLKRNKIYTIINILGLTIGLATTLVVFLLLRYELSFEQMHSQGERIYRLVNSRKNSSGWNHNAETPYPAASALRLDFPELEKVTGIHYQEEALVRIDDQKFQEERIIFADSNFLDVFDFGYGTQLEVMGNAKRSLQEPGFALLSEDIAKKYFGGENPLGKRLRLNNELEVEVGAVIRNAPDNTHLRYHMIISYASLTPEYTDFPLDSWGFVSSGFTYILLPDHMAPQQLEQGLDALVRKYYEEAAWPDTEYALQALDNIHFDDTYINGLSTTPVKRQYITVMTLVGVFIMLIACINFVNLSTALGFRKSKEVGVRKVLGAVRSNLIGQLSGEALILTVLSWILALACLLQVLPILNSYLQKNVVLDLLKDGYFWFFSVVVVLLVSLLSGLYPAFVISGFQPVTALKNKITSHSKSSLWLRRGLVVFQFLIAQVLIIVTLIIASQMSFIRNTPMGFDKEAIINVDIPEPDSSKLATFYNSLQDETGINGISFGLAAPNDNANAVTPFYETNSEEQERYLVNVKPVDHHYQEVYGLTLITGRWFEDYDLNSHSEESRFVVNEQVARKLGYTHPEEIVGKHITTGFGNQSGEVIGVVADFHLSSLHQEIMPVCFVPFPRLFYHAGIKLSPGSYRQGIEKVQQAWTALFPDHLFHYEFMDAQLAGLYKEDERTFTLFRIFSATSIFIGCLGLFALISFLVEQKRKEVSIRKVLGASVSHIVFLFSKEFSQLVLLAFLVAVPLAWYFADSWLANFVYRVEVGYNIFLIGGLTALTIAFASVAWQSLKAALENPVDSLKND